MTWQLLLPAASRFDLQVVHSMPAKPKHGVDLLPAPKKGDQQQGKVRSCGVQCSMAAAGPQVFCCIFNVNIAYVAQLWCIDIGHLRCTLCASWHAA